MGGLVPRFGDIPRPTCSPDLTTSLLLWRYNSDRVLAFSTISFHLGRSWTCSAHFVSFIFFRSLLTSSSQIAPFIMGLTRVGCLRFISLPFFCREFLACQVFQDGVAGLVLNPRYLGGPRIFCRGCLP